MPPRNPPPTTPVRQLSRKAQPSARKRALSKALSSRIRPIPLSQRTKKTRTTSKRPAQRPARRPAALPAAPLPKTIDVDGETEPAEEEAVEDDGIISSSKGEDTNAKLLEEKMRYLAL